MPNIRHWYVWLKCHEPTAVTDMSDVVKYYTLTDDITKNPTGVVLLNLNDFYPQGAQSIYSFDQGVRGFSRFSSKVEPHLGYDRKKGRLPKDFELFEGYWLLSNAAKSAFESVDPLGFEFIRCRFTANISGQPSILWLCDVVRVIDAINEEKSKVWIIDPDRKRYGLSGANKLVFFPGKIGTAHIFRMEYNRNCIICDESIRIACKAAKIKGIMFRDAVEKRDLRLEGTEI